MISLHYLWEVHRQAGAEKYELGFQFTRIKKMDMSNQDESVLPQNINWLQLKSESAQVECTYPELADLTVRLNVV